MPTVAATWVMGTPSATSKIVWPRRARPAEIVVARCQARRVRRSPGVRQMVRAVVCPRAIQNLSVLELFVSISVFSHFYGQFW